MKITPNDALLIVDVQNDFLPEGAVPVPKGNEIIPFLNSYIAIFSRHFQPIFATRDWHPPRHCSFEEQGGVWPVHCVAESHGAKFPTALRLPRAAMVVSKARTEKNDAYSGFDNTNLAGQLRLRSITRVFVTGLATDYCVFQTVKDALALSFKVILLRDAIRAIDIKPDDGSNAIKEMVRRGAVLVELKDMEE